MATEKIRFTVIVDDETMEAIGNYQHGNRIKSQSRAVNQLIEKGLALNEKAMMEKAKGPSDAALEVAQAFDQAPTLIQNAVRRIFELSVIGKR